MQTVFYYYMSHQSQYCVCKVRTATVAVPTVIPVTVLTYGSFPFYHFPFYRFPIFRFRFYHLPPQRRPDGRLCFVNTGEQSNDAGWLNVDVGW